MISSKPNHLSKALPPNTLPLGVRFQHMNFVGTRTVHNRCIHWSPSFRIWKDLRNAIIQTLCFTDEETLVQEGYNFFRTSFGKCQGCDENPDVTCFVHTSFCYLGYCLPFAGQFSVISRLCACQKQLEGMDDTMGDVCCQSMVSDSQSQHCLVGLLFLNHLIANGGQCLWLCGFNNQAFLWQSVPPSHGCFFFRSTQMQTLP